jgi:hypothetical protein
MFYAHDLESERIKRCFRVKELLLRHSDEEKQWNKGVVSENHSSPFIQSDQMIYWVISLIFLALSGTRNIIEIPHQRAVFTAR